MIRRLLLVLAFALPGCTRSDGPRSPALSTAPRQASDTVVFRLHKFLQDIGTERDTYTPVAGGVEAKASFSFRDRGTTVPLAARYLLTADGAVQRFEVWGSTSRLSLIDEAVERLPDGSYVVKRLGGPDARVRPASPPVAASGYAPVLGQDLLLRAWVARGRPRTMQLLPEATVTIESRGRETYDGEGGKKVALEHVALSGLVWGREDAWLDGAGKLVAVVTRDAEFDSFAAVREGFFALLPELAGRAGSDGVAALLDRASPGRTAALVMAVVGGTLIDGTGRAPVADSVVVIEGGRITAAGPRGSTKVPPKAMVVDASGKWVIPGLWDMHAHFSLLEQGAAYLAAGVTTVRDMGNVLEFITGVRDAIDKGKGLGPRVLVSGIVDGEGDRAIGTVRIKTADDIVPVLDRLVAAGCREVKIYQSIAPALVKPIAAAARARGLRVVGHVPSGMDVLEAVEAGYDSVSHLPAVLGPVLPEAEMRKLSRTEQFRRIAAINLGSAKVRRILDLLARKKTVIDDTLVLYDLILHTEARNRRNEPGIAKLPPALAGVVPSMTPSLEREASAAFELHVKLLGELHRRGVPIVAGTDIGVPAHSLHRELEIYVQAGFTPLEALQAATIVPARAMKLDREVGTVEPGKRADLVILDGDPLADIRAVRRVVRVVSGGVAFDPAVLWRLADFKP